MSANVVTVVTSGKRMARIILAVTSMALEKPLARRMIGMIKKDCANCSHSLSLTSSDVQTCNCCEDMEYFDPLPEEDQIFLETLN